MTDLLRKVTHEERMAVGDEICKLALSKYGERVLAVLVWASTGKKLDRPYSDLEVGIVVRDEVDIPSKYYMYRGLVIQIDYPQEKGILKGARKLSQFWPIEADQYRNRIVLFERDNWTNKLREAVDENDRVDLSDALRHATVSVIESLASLRNAELTGDLMDLWSRTVYLAADAGRAIYLLNRKYVITTSWFWKQLFEFKEKPANFDSHIRKLISFNLSPTDAIEACEELVKGVVELVEARGVSVESNELVV